MLELFILPLNVLNAFNKIRYNAADQKMSTHGKSDFKDVTEIVITDMRYNLPTMFAENYFSLSQSFRLGSNARTAKTVDDGLMVEVNVL